MLVFWGWKNKPFLYSSFMQKQNVLFYLSDGEVSSGLMFSFVGRMVSTKSFIKISRFLRTTQLNFEWFCFRHCYQISKNVVLLYLDGMQKGGCHEHCKGNAMIKLSFLLSRCCKRGGDGDVLDFTEQFVPYLIQKVKSVLSCRSTIPRYSWLITYVS